MRVKSIMDYERKSLEKMKNLQLPHRFKVIGIWLFILSIVALFINKFSVNDLEIRAIVKYGMLIGLLLISISKEKIEDELITKLRMQSYTLAFIMGVIFTLLLPFVDYLIDLVFKTNEAVLKDLGDWQILWLLLSIQVFYFAILKKMHK